MILFQMSYIKLNVVFEQELGILKRNTVMYAGISNNNCTPHYHLCEICSGAMLKTTYDTRFAGCPEQQDHKLGFCFNCDKLYKTIIKEVPNHDKAMSMAINLWEEKLSKLDWQALNKLTHQLIRQLV